MLPEISTYRLTKVPSRRDHQAFVDSLVDPLEDGLEDGLEDPLDLTEVVFTTVGALGFPRGAHPLDRCIIFVNTITKPRTTTTYKS